MSRFLLRRFLWLWPTLWLIMVFTFMLTALAPDPSANFMADCNYRSMGTSYEDFAACLAKKRAELRLDLPRFYVTVSTLATPKDFHRYARYVRPTLRRLLFQVGDGGKVEAYHRAVQQLMVVADEQRLAGKLPISVVSLMLGLEALSDLKKIEARLTQLADSGQFYPGAWVATLAQAQRHFEQMREQPARWRNFIPMLYWHGLDNQYHHWLMGMLRGDLGRSYRSTQSVGSTIRELLPWTITLAGMGTVLIFLTGIPLGIFSAMYPGSLGDRGSAMLGFVLEVIPTFWLGTLLFSYFADPEMLGGGFLAPDLHPGQLSWQQYLTQLPLPLIAYAYAGFAQISRLLRSTLQEQMQMPYLRTALAKGLSYRQAVWRHAFRNTLLPLITVATGVLPALLVGAVVVEEVFLIRGLGRETLEAVKTNDVPFVMAMFTLTALATLLGYFIADWLYARVDPRVRDSLG